MSTELFVSAINTGIRHWLGSRRWFGGKARAIVRLEIAEIIPLPAPGGNLALIKVEYTVGEPDLYSVPFVLLKNAKAERLSAAHPDAVMHNVERGPESPAMILFDGLADPKFVRQLLDALAAEEEFTSAPQSSALQDGEPASQALKRQSGKLSAWADPRLKEILAREPLAFDPVVGQGDQSNSCIPCGKKLILKLFRRLAPGVNPDLEIGRFLTQTAKFPYVPPMLGAFEYQPPQGEALTVGVLQQFVEGRSAWEFTLESLTGFFARLAKLAVEDWPTPREAFQPTTEPSDSGPGEAADRSFWALASKHPAPAAERLAGDYLRRVALLGQRTAELHLALASNSDQPAFAPEPFTEKHQNEMRWSMRDLAARTCELLRQRLPQLSATLAPAAKEVLDSQPELLIRFDELGAGCIDAQRLRVHGDYHLGQVLYTGSDFAIIDFEGEPARSLEWRRSKRSPLVDVAGMLRSYHYAASQALFQQLGAEARTPAAADALRSAADAWYAWAAAAFMRAYVGTATAGSFLPSSPADCDKLLTLFVLEKAVYELAYELNNRPDWVEVPLRGLLGLLGRTT